MVDSFDLQIVNYQRIRKAKLSFVPGLNVILGQSNQGKCFVGDTYVRLKEGIRRIDSLPYGWETDEFLPVEGVECYDSGKLCRVSHTYNSGVRRTVKLYSRGIQILECTENELIAVMRGGKEELVRADEIVVGDRIIKDIHRVEWFRGYRHIDWTSNEYFRIMVLEDYSSLAPATRTRYLNDRKDKPILVQKFPRHMTEDLAYVLGLVYGDGWSRGYESSDRELIDSYKRITKEIFGSEVNEVEVRPGYWSCGFGSQIGRPNTFREYLKMIGFMGSNSFSKKVPEDILNSDYYCQLAFVQGLMDTDGSVDKGHRVEYSSNSLDLCRFVQQVVEALGYPTTMYKRDNSYRLECAQTSAELFRLIRKRDRCKADTYGRLCDSSKCRNRVPFYNTVLDGWYKEVEIDGIGVGEAQCYDITNSETHMFVANSYRVHNTAIFRAVQTAIFNLPRESHVTLGETKSAVGIRYRDHEVIWRRDTEAASPVTYRVDGKILSKLGRGQPESVAAAFGIKEVELDDTKMKVNFQKQMEYPFLLDKTPSQLFKFIMQSAEEDNVMDVVQTMKSDLNTISSNVKAYEEARESLRIATKREVARYNEKKKAVPYCDRVLALDGQVKNYQRLKAIIEACQDNLVTISQGITELEQLTEILNKTDSIYKKLQKQVSNLTTVATKVQYIVDLGSQVKGYSDEYSRVASELEFYSGLDSYVAVLKRVKDSQERVTEISSVVTFIRGLAEDARGKKQEVAELEEVISSFNEGIKKASSVIEDYDSYLISSGKLQKLIDELKSGKEQYEATKRELEIVKSEIKEVEVELQDFDICPFCGSPLGGKHEQH